MGEFTQSTFHSCGEGGREFIEKRQPVVGFGFRTELGALRKVVGVGRVMVAGRGAQERQLSSPGLTKVRLFCFLAHCRGSWHQASVNCNQKGVRGWQLRATQDLGEGEVWSLDKLGSEFYWPSQVPAVQ